jgi:hypothetical protein
MIELLESLGINLPTAVTWLVIGIILVIMARGLRVLARSRGQLQRERRFKDMLREKMSELQDHRLPPEELYAELVPFTDTNLGKSWIASRIQSLRDHAMRDLNPDLDLLRQSDENRVESELASPIHAANSSVLFGLLGTFGGLALTIARIVGMLEGRGNKDPGEMIVRGLDGAEMAFYTSIAGVVSMILISSLVSRTRRNWSLHLEQVNRFVEVDLVKAFFSGKAEDQLQQGMRDLALQSAELGEKVGQLGSVAITIQGSLSTLVVASRAFQDGAERLGELRQSVETQLETSQALNQDFLHLGNRIADGLTGQGVVLGEAGVKFDQLLTALTERREDLTNALDSIQQAFAGLGSLPEDLSRRLGEEAESAARRHIDVLKDLNDTYLKRLGPDNEALHETARILQLFAKENLPALQAALKSVGEEIRREALPEIRQYSQRLHEEMQKLVSKHNEQFEQYLLLLTELRQSVETLSSQTGPRRI